MKMFSRNIRTRKMEGINGHPLFSRVTWLSLAVIIVLYGISVWLNLTAKRRADQEFLGSIYSRISYFVSTLEENISKIGLAQDHLSSDSNINLLSIDTNQVFSDYDRLKMVRDIQRVLVQFYNSNHLLQGTEIQIRNIGRKITCFYSVQELDQEEYEKMTRFCREEEQGLYYDGSRIMVLNAYPQAGVRNLEPLYIIGAQLDTEEIRKELELLSQNSSSRIVLAADDGSWAIGDKELLEENGQKLNTESYIWDGGKKFYVDRIRAEKLGVTVYALIPGDVVAYNSRSYLLFFGLITLLVVLLVAGICRRLYRMLGKPMEELMQGIDIVKKGQLDYRIPYMGKDEFAYLYQNFNEMAGNIQELNRTVAQQERLVVEARLKELEYQINPHFLYNSLYLIYRLAQRGEDEGIARISQYLGGFYRYITKKPSRFVELREEVEHCRRYVGIQSIRFQEQVEITFGELDPAYEAFQVPVLSMQPIIENAFEHGIRNVSGKGKIDIYFEKSQNILRFIVEDNGPGYTKEEVEELNTRISTESEEVVSGLVNVGKRIKGYFGSQGSLLFQESRYGGAKTVLEMDVTLKTVKAQTAERTQWGE